MKVKKIRILVFIFASLIFGSVAISVITFGFEQTDEKELTTLNLSDSFGLDYMHYVVRIAENVGPEGSIHWEFSGSNSFVGIIVVAMDPENWELFLIDYGLTVGYELSDGSYYVDSGDWTPVKQTTWHIAFINLDSDQQSTVLTFSIICTGCVPIGPIVGMVIGVLVPVVAVIAIVGYLVYRRKMKERELPLSLEKEPEIVPKKNKLKIIVILAASLLTALYYYIMIMLAYDLYWKKDDYLNFYTFAFYYWVFAPLYIISIVILIKGTNKLRNFKRDQIVKWAAYSAVLLFSLITIVGFLGQIYHHYFPSLWDLYELIPLGLILNIPIPTSFIILGVSNRQRFGNYLVSAGMIMIFYSVSHLILVSSYYVFINLWTTGVDDHFYMLGFVSWFITIALYSSFLFFFGIKLRNKYFVVYSILDFISHTGLLYLHYSADIPVWWFTITILYLSFFLLGILIAIRFFELGKRFKRGFRVFITHSVDDFNRYRIQDIVNFLESQKGISRVFYCETDLSGNIDEWMQKIVPRCHLLIFISTEESIISQDCLTELNLARSSQLQIVPVLGIGLVWDDLEKLDIHREFGAPFEPMKFEGFCTTIYERIMKYKEAVESELPKKK